MRSHESSYFLLFCLSFVALLWRWMVIRAREVLFERWTESQGGLFVFGHSSQALAFLIVLPQSRIHISRRKSQLLFFLGSRTRVSVIPYNYMKAVHIVVKETRKMRYNMMYNWERAVQFKKMRNVDGQGEKYLWGPFLIMKKEHYHY